MEDWQYEPYRMVGAAHSVSSESQPEQRRNPIGFIWPDQSKHIELPTRDEIEKYGT